MGVLTTHGMGEGKPPEPCEGCGDNDVRGRTLHLKDLSGAGDYGWVCDWCYRYFKEMNG